MGLELRELGLPGVLLIRPRKHEDARGFFSETYSKREFAAAEIDLDFVQDNQSLSRAAGTIRGFHYQVPPFAQAKLVRVARGRILDVAIDVRRGSPTFGRSVTAEISAAAWNQILVPVGYAHAICTLESDTEVIYKVTNFYSAEHEYGIRWDDPSLDLAWPFAPEEVILSDKDRAHPLLRDAVHLL
jgi:dTDP-4-dehydrorhamnose 3,5-epimerase